MSARAAILGVSGALALGCGCAGAGGDEGESSATSSETSEGGATDGTTGSSMSGGTTMKDPGLPEPHTWELSLSLDTSRGAIFSVWGDGPENIVAVGGQPTAGLQLRYQGGAWVEEPLPPMTPRLSWVAGIEGRLYAAGYFGALLRREDEGWASEVSGVDEPLWGVWGASEAEVWAVGGGAPPAPPVLLRRTAGAWQRVDVAAISGDGHALYKIWGRAADDIYAVGARGLVLHYDGVEWRREESGTSVTLIGVFGDPNGEDVVVAGGRSSGVVLRRSGGLWQVRGLPEEDGLDGAWIDEDGVATVVGRRGFIGVFPRESAGWVREASGVEDELHAVFGVPGGPVFAVGGRFDMAPYTGVILRRSP